MYVCGRVDEAVRSTMSRVAGVSPDPPRVGSFYTGLFTCPTIPGSEEKGEGAAFELRRKVIHVAAGAYGPIFLTKQTPMEAPMTTTRAPIMMPTIGPAVSAAVNLMLPMPDACAKSAENVAQLLTAIIPRLSFVAAP